MNMETFFDKSTSTLTYLLWTKKKNAVIIDPVLGYDPASSKTDQSPLDPLLEVLREKDLQLHWIIETHVHADHLSGAQVLKDVFPEAKVAIGKEIVRVQKTFQELFSPDSEFFCDGRPFDVLFSDKETLVAGDLKIQALHTPGHTEVCYSLLIENKVFTGDALFMPDFGVARCDFPNGCAKTLYNSVTKKLYELPDETATFTGHDYQPGGRELRFESTIGDQKLHNVHLQAKTTEADFVAFRSARDKQLGTPRLFYPSLFVNTQAGKMPSPEKNGLGYLKIPIFPENKKKDD